MWLRFYVATFFLDSESISWFTRYMQKNVRRVSGVFICIFILWTLYRYYSHFPGWVDDFIAKPLLWLPIVFYLVQYIEKKQLGSIGLSTKHFKRNIGIGLIGSLVLSIELGGSVLVRSHGHLTHTSVTIDSLIRLFMSSFATGFVEEVLFRGYIQSRLFNIFHTPVLPIGIASALFSIVHLPIIIFVLHYPLGQLLSYCFLIFMLGIIDGYLFWRTKTLTASITVHTMWDVLSSIIH